MGDAMRKTILTFALLLSGLNAWAGPEERHGIRGKDDAINALETALGAMTGKALE
jgi:hypothetical protein